MSEYLNSKNIVPNANCRMDHDISPWLDEQVWGHRLWDSQSPWLLFLEFLTVAEACLRENKLFDEKGVYYPLRFRPYQRLYLRNILFNNQFVNKSFSQIDTQRDDNGIWKVWIQQMNSEAQGDLDRDFSYLKDQFSSFRDFDTVVRMLRRTAVEGDRNRRWSSRFIFPFGSEALYEDLNIKRSTASREYINFGRTGELLYLMLCRSKFAEVLRGPMKLLLQNNYLNEFLKRLQPDKEDDLSNRGRSYLPYIKHPCFDFLGEDWKNVFDLELPGFDAYQYLVGLSAFHVILYQLNTAAGFIPNSHKPHFVCEVIAPQKTLVRELSISNYQRNNALTAQAVDAYISCISESDAWLTTIEDFAEADAFVKCKEILQDKVWWPPPQVDAPNGYDGPPNPGALIKQLREFARKGHRQHAGNVHRVYGRAVGLISSRGTKWLRYAPNDIFLKTLVVANVKKRKEFNEFLDDLYKRYGLVFGEQEASQTLSVEEFDRKAFQANTERLERRLSSMGMLRRLSDACAYVTNPFAREEE